MPINVAHFEYQRNWLGCRFWVDEVKVARDKNAGLTKLLLNDMDAYGPNRASFHDKFARWSERYKTDILGSDWAGQWEMLTCSRELQLQLAVYKLGPLQDHGVRSADLLLRYPLEGTNAPWAHLLFQDFGDCCGHFETTDIPYDFEPQHPTHLGKC